MKRISVHNLLIGVGVFAVAILGSLIVYNKHALRVLETDDTRDIVAVKRDLVKTFVDSYTREISPGPIREFEIVASKTRYAGIDGEMIDGYAYNGQVPGPQMRITLGETIRIRFTNDLPEETTIHFHGIRVTNAMDGVPGVTQDPIRPGGSFVYEFTPKDAGTFWYHPHVRASEQVEKGLYGVIVVDELEAPGFSQDLVWVLDDWRVTQEWQIDTRFNTMHDLMHDGRWGQIVTTNGKTVEDIRLNPGEHVRVRMVNVSNARDYRVHFGALSAMAIAVDGMPLKDPFDANGFEIAPGNRIDIDLSAPEEIAGKTVDVTDTFTFATNILGKVHVTMDTMSAAAPSHLALPHYPDWSAAQRIPADYAFELSASGGGVHGLAWKINNEAYPDVTKTTLKAGEFYKLRITNASARLHPMHLHGQFFQVLERNGSTVASPYWQDTVLLKARETVEIGIVPVDVGSWAYHCHALEHAEAGMMSVIEVI